MPPSPACRPAVGPGLLFLAGVGLAWNDALLPATLAGAAAVCRRPGSRPRPLAVLGLLALLGAGQWAGDAARRDAGERVAGWLPWDGRPVEMEFQGKLLGAPEPGARGERLLRIRGAPTGRAHRRGPPAVVLLRIRPGSPGPGASLDGLRRGDEVRAWCRLRLPRGTGGPAEGGLRAALVAQGIDATGTVKSMRLVERLGRGRGGPGRILDHLRAAARTRLDRAVPPEGAGRAVLGAMVLGDRAALPGETLRALREAGLVHLISISGMHASLVVAAVLGVLRRSALPFGGSFALAVPLLACFAFVVGAMPPVLRAVMAACLMLLGRLIHREGNSINTLVVVAALLAAWRPFLLWDAGFQLSFLATSGIVLFAVPTARSLPLPRILAVPLAVTLAAYVATAPLAAWHFGLLAPVSVLSNLAAAPLCAAILLPGAAAIVLEGFPGLGAASSWAAERAAEALLALSPAAGALPGAFVRVPAPARAWMAGYYLLLASAAVRDGGPVVSRLRTLALALLLAALHLGAPPPGPGAPALAAILDVGQGQAVVLRGTGGSCVLVDCGGTSGGRFDAGERVVLRELPRLGCRRVDSLILTHGHDDHIGGAGAVLREIEVGELWVAVGSHRDPPSSALVELARLRGVPAVTVRRGTEMRRGGLQIEVLHPTGGESALDSNNRSLVVRVSPGHGRILIVGDLERPGEERLLDAAVDVESDALVVGHHGASSGTSPDFLRAVHPEVAVISVGAWNRFGHPASGVLERLRARGVRVYRTDRHGTVRLVRTSRGWERDP